MLHGVLVDVDVPVGVAGRQRARLDPVRCRLARYDVQHVVGQRGVGPALADAGDRDLVTRRVDGRHLGVGVQVNAVVGDDRVQVVGDRRDAEDPRCRHDEVDVDVVEHAFLSPVVAGQVGDLLWRAGALDRPGRHGEHRGARSGGPDEVPGARGEVEPVVRRHAVPAERVLESLGAVPVELDARTDHQHVVGVGRPVGTRDGVVVRVEGRGGVLDPGRLLGHHRGFGALGRRRLRLAAADEGPQRLVVVHARRLDDRDVGIPLTEQAGRDRDAGRAATDDQDLVLGGGHGVPPR